MTRKDYVLIARALKQAKQNDVIWRRIVTAIAGELKDDNERFDIPRFYVACGYVDEQKETFDASTVEADPMAAQRNGM